MKKFGLLKTGCSLNKQTSNPNQHQPFLCLIAHTFSETQDQHTFDHRSILLETMFEKSFSQHKDHVKNKNKSAKHSKSFQQNFNLPPLPKEAIQNILNVMGIIWNKFSSKATQVLWFFGNQFQLKKPKKVSISGLSTKPSLLLRLNIKNSSMELAVI